MILQRVLFIFFVFIAQLASAQKITFENLHQHNSDLPKNYISDIVFDQNNDIWIGTWGGGAVHIKKGQWISYNTSNSTLRSNQVNDIFIDKNKMVWLALDGGGIAKFDGKKWKHYDVPKDNYALVIKEDDKGRMFVGTYNSGLYLLQNDTIKKQWDEGAYFEDGVNDILFSGNKIYIATRIGVLEYDGKSWAKHILKGAVLNIEKDKEGNIWASMSPGGALAVFKNGNWEYLFEDASNFKKAATNYIQTMMMNDDGEIFINDQEGNLVKYSNGKWEKVKVQGAGGAGITALAKDKDGKLWIGTYSKGLFIEKDIADEEIVEIDNIENGKLLNRNINYQNTANVKSRKITIEIWDDQKEDGDSISVNFNGKWLLENYELKSKAISLELELNNTENFLVLHALNLGIVPPNSAAIAVIDGYKRRKYKLISDIENSGTLRILLE